MGTARLDCAPMDEPHVDTEAIQTGAIPWSENELVEAMDHFEWLSTTPHDDWDRKPERISIEFGDGRVETLRFNPDMVDNQMASFIRDRCRARGYDRTTTMSHMWRFMEIRSFVAQKYERLVADGLIRPEPNQERAAYFATELFAELAVAPYAAVTVHERTGESGRTFDYEAVVAGAKARMSDNDLPPAEERAGDRPDGE